MKIKSLIAMTSGTFLAGAAGDLENIDINAARTVGYIPKTFPRDPLNVNIAGEHLILSQILETLVTHDNEGNLISGIAKSWKFSPDSLSITFELDESKKFTSGRSVLAKDVVYSIDRHRKSKESQSHQFLQNIEYIKESGDKNVLIKLKRPQLSILKALSRSQIGIVPIGWTFDPNSNNPIVGSGKYELFRSNGDWFLKYREDATNKIKSGEVVKAWKIIFGAPTEEEIKKLPIPDYIPLARTMVVKNLSLNKNYDTKSYYVQESFSLGQTGAWWFPRGKNFADVEFKTTAMAALRELFELRRSELEYRQSTGLIPSGVPGHLLESIKFATAKPLKKRRTVKIMLSAANALEIFKNQNVKDVELKYNIDFDVKIESSNWKNDLEIERPDVYVVSWLGGFADPEGFLPVLTSMLQIDIKQYLGDKAETYINASSELSWEKRGLLFQKFNEALLRTENFVPAWQPTIFSVLKNDLKAERILFRYTPDFTEIRKSK